MPGIIAFAEQYTVPELEPMQKHYMIVERKR